MRRQRRRRKPTDVPVPAYRAQPEPDQQLALVQETYHHSGPLPAPEILSKYDEILPGAAQRIISMAEKEQTSAIDSRAFALRETAAETKRGQWLAFGIAMSAFVTAGILGFLGHQVAETVIGGSTVGGLVATFVVGRRSPDH